MMFATIFLLKLRLATHEKNISSTYSVLMIFNVILDSKFCLLFDIMPHALTYLCRKCLITTFRKSLQKCVFMYI